MPDPLDKGPDTGARLDVRMVEGHETDALFDAAESALRHDADVAALRSSERRYRGLFECALDGIAVVDAVRGTLVDANPSLEALLGFRPEEILGRRLADLVATPDRAALEASLAGLKAGGSFRLEPLRLTGKGGATVEVEFIANAYEIDEERYVRCNVRDIGERLAAQRRMNEQLEELRQFQRVTVDRELRMQELEVELERIRDGPH